MDFHPGIDYGSVNGHDPIFAVDDGVVVTSRNDEDGYGLYLVIEHKGYCSLYAHLHVRKVDVGMRVKKGDPIALKGTTGSSTGIHLHFEIRDVLYSKFWAKYPNGEWVHSVDPEKFYLQKGAYEDIPEDEADTYAQKSWIKMFNLGILDGTGPKEPLTRQDFAVALDRIRIGGLYE